MAEEIVELDQDADSLDPDATPPASREVVTQHYDLVVGSLIDQIRSSDIVLRPAFQRGYVWPNRMASRLIESIVLNVPIPACFLAQNDDFEMDVVDGQQRLESIRRFVENEFALSGLEVTPEFNGKRFHQLPAKTQRQIKTHTIRCVMITNKSHPDIKFEVFERLNSNMSSLNAQELRNCLYRGALNDLVKELAKGKSWLTVIGRKEPDKRMRGEELILRFFALHLLGQESYRTPLKNWLNDAASKGRKLGSSEVETLRSTWTNMLAVSSKLFSPRECFRRPDNKPINKALFDLVAGTASKMSLDDVGKIRDKFRESYNTILSNPEFEDLISRSVDHKKRTAKRHELWNEQFAWLSS